MLLLVKRINFMSLLAALAYFHILFTVKMNGNNIGFWFVLLKCPFAIGRLLVIFVLVVESPRVRRVVDC